MSLVPTQTKGRPLTMETILCVKRAAGGRVACAAWLAVLCMLAVGCARLPVPVQVIHEDERLLVSVERVGKAGSYTHPITLSPQEVAALLTGFSSLERPATGLLRWFGKPAAPKPVFVEGDIQALASYLAEGLRAALPDERVSFALYGEGKNPNVERVVTSGWIAVRDPFFHFALDYLRSLQPRTEARGYYPFYPDLPSASPAYDVYFEPTTFWQQDPSDGTSAVHIRDYLRSAGKPDGG
jgi:hypothetical protein